MRFRANNAIRENQKLREELRRTETIVSIYTKHRWWMEEQASRSYEMIRFTEYRPSLIHRVVSDRDAIFLGTGSYGSVLQCKIGEKTVAVKIPNNRDSRQPLGMWSSDPSASPLLGCPRRRGDGRRPELAGDGEVKPSGRESRKPRWHDSAGRSNGSSRRVMPGSRTESLLSTVSSASPPVDRRRRLTGRGTLLRAQR